MLVRIGRYCFETLLGKEIPVWLSLLLMLMGAWATYILAPMVNEQFELQAARREFLVGMLNEHSSQSGEIMDLTAELLNSRDPESHEKSLLEIRSLALKAQFASLRLNSTLPGDTQIVLRYQERLSALIESINRHDIGTDSSDIKIKLKEFGVSSVETYEKLLYQAGLR